MIELLIGLNLVSCHFSFGFIQSSVDLLLDLNRSLMIVNSGTGDLPGGFELLAQSRVSFSYFCIGDVRLEILSDVFVEYMLDSADHLA